VGGTSMMGWLVIGLGGEQDRLVLTHHHLLMDGWSLPVLVHELLTLYAHKGDCAALGRVTPYRDYLAWIAAQDRAAAVSAWQEALAGAEERTRVGPPGRGRLAGAAGKVSRALRQASPPGA